MGPYPVGELTIRQQRIRTVLMKSTKVKLRKSENKSEFERKNVETRCKKEER